VSGLNPPLRNTEYVLGDKERLILILLKGSNKGLVVNEMTYSNAMPGFPNLSNEEIAYIASYIRNSFSNSAEPVSISEVAQVREKS
jgi:mono/diheme cytochrome c family protein